MMYPFLTLDDETEIVHSEMKPDGQVKVYVEKPDEKDGFHNAACFLPSYRWEEINGFTSEEIARYQEIIESTAHLIIRFSKNGGFEHAADF
ncbi:MAG: hypothetical protein IJQ36_03185 [Oscillospiraceae bacterium]|nr:hypothetical protein [Oscillospiraceae bacterium]